MITVKTILEYHLKSIGADGLCNPGEECGCGLDDLMPCGCDLNLEECVAAKLVKSEPDSHEMFAFGPEYYQAI